MSETENTGTPPPPLTELERTIDEALAKTQGNFRRAAIIVGLRVPRLREHAMTSPYLCRKWLDTEQHVTHEEIELAKQADLEDDSVRKGLAAMGLNQKQSNLAVSLKRFQGQHYHSSLSLISGGITKQFIATLTDLEEIELRLSDISSRKLNGEKFEISEEVMLRDDRARLNLILGQFFNQSHTAALALAKIKQIINGGKNGKPGDSRRPGFSPLKSANPNESELPAQEKQNG